MSESELKSKQMRTRKREGENESRRIWKISCKPTCAYIILPGAPHLLL